MALYVHIYASLAFEPEMRHSAVNSNNAKCELSNQKIETAMFLQSCCVKCQLLKQRDETATFTNRAKYYQIAFNPEMR